MTSKPRSEKKYTLRNSFRCALDACLGGTQMETNMWEVGCCSLDLGLFFLARVFRRVMKWISTFKSNFFSSTPYAHGKHSPGRLGEQLRRPAQAARVASQELASGVLAALHPWGGFWCASLVASMCGPRV